MKSNLLNKFADKLDEHADEICTLECEDNGKPYADAMHDLQFCKTLIQYYGG